MLNICFVYFFFLLLFSFSCFSLSIYFMVLDLVYFLEFNFLMINSGSLVMTFLFDWMTLLFMSFVLFISGMVVFYSYDYMHGDLNINRFILLVIMFVASMMLLIVSPNLIGVSRVSTCLLLFSNLLSKY